MSDEHPLGPLGEMDYPDSAASCKGQVRIYDYVDGRLLVERENDGSSSTMPSDRHVSVYTWGAMGLIARRGVSVRDGSYDPETRVFTPTEVPNAMRDYTYMTDQMGNVAALVTCERGMAQRQVFDAFGNLVNGGGNSYITFRCASDFDNGEWTAGRLCGYPPISVGSCEDPEAIDCDPPCPDPLPDAKPIERMQTGGFNWRGAEGSITDRNAEDQRAKANPDKLVRSAYTQPSTGLIYMQARYYEPETGRFTQADPVPYGFETALTGQSNRWAYCANDPVNSSDPSGQVASFWGGLVGLLGVAAGLLTGGLIGWLGVAAGAIVMAMSGWLTAIAGFVVALWLPLLFIALIVAVVLWWWFADGGGRDCFFPLEGDTLAMDMRNMG